jgi:hypothetical protein
MIVACLAVHLYHLAMPSRKALARTYPTITRYARLRLRFASSRQPAA